MFSNSIRQKARSFFPNARTQQVHYVIQRRKEQLIRLLLVGSRILFSSSLSLFLSLSLSLSLLSLFIYLAILHTDWINSSQNENEKIEDNEIVFYHLYLNDLSLDHIFCYHCYFCSRQTTDRTNDYFIDNFELLPHDSFNNYQRVFALQFALTSRVLHSIILRYRMKILQIAICIATNRRTKVDVKAET